VASKLGRLPLPTLCALMLAVGFVTVVPSSAGAAVVPLPVEAAFSAPGPFATTTGTVMKGSKVEYDLFYPSDYASVGFKSPIITWGNGTGDVPDMYSTLLLQFASYGFTVIATTRKNSGSGREIDAAARYMVKLITTLITFSLPSASVATTNPDCPVVSDCEENMASVHQPTFLISTYGPEDRYIASPRVERAYFGEVKGRAALGTIKTSGGVKVDHASIENATYGGNPGEEIAYATAWLEFTLRGNQQAAQAFAGPHPELTSNPAWPGSKVKS
jgi:hypothetical protein